LQKTGIGGGFLYEKQFQRVPGSLFFLLKRALAVYNVSFFDKSLFRRFGAASFLIRKKCKNRQKKEKNARYILA